MKKLIEQVPKPRRCFHVFDPRRPQRPFQGVERAVPSGYIFREHDKYREQVNDPEPRTENPRPPARRPENNAYEPADNEHEI